jgi:hypothetical protein
MSGRRTQWMISAFVTHTAASNKKGKADEKVTFGTTKLINGD